MDRIEQIEWARQILGEKPVVTERDDETVRYLTEANLKLRTALEEMTSKRDEATNRAHGHLEAGNYWKAKSKRQDELLRSSGSVNEGLMRQIEERKKEIQRLKKKVNRLIRKGKTK